MGVLGRKHGMRRVRGLRAMAVLDRAGAPASLRPAAMEMPPIHHGTEAEPVLPGMRLPKQRKSSKKD